MTVPSGARTAAASGARRDDAAELRDDDPKLSAMRAVWLAMLDEDPPERGLTELLAAARVAGAAMHGRPTLWQRLVSGLQRPPALAFATVLVLVGGAVIIGRRGVDVPSGRATMEPAPPVPLAPGAPGVDGNAAPGEVATKPGAADERPAVTDGPGKVELAVERSVRAGGERTAAPAVEQTVGTGERTSPSPTSTKTASVVERAGVREDGAGKTEPAIERAGRIDGRTLPSPASGKTASVVAPPDPARDAAGSAPVGADLKDTDVGASDAVRHPTPRGTAAPTKGALKAGSTWNAAGLREPRLPPMREPRGSFDDLDGAGSPARAEPPPPAEAVEATKKADRVEPMLTRHDKQQAAPALPLEQLYKQCEAAARRGDCATVRGLVGRITRSVPGYRARLARDSAVAKCLAE